MGRPKGKPSLSVTEQVLDEASWLLSHAQALADYGRQNEADAELARAASCEEQVAGLLDADGQEHEAAIHRVSAASCFEKLGQYARAATLLRAAISAKLPGDHRARLEHQLARCLARIPKELADAVTHRARPKSTSVR